MSISSRLNWNLIVLVFEERGKPKYPENNLLKQRREQTTNSTHIWCQHRDLNPGHIGGRRVPSPLRKYRNPHQHHHHPIPMLKGMFQWNLPFCWSDRLEKNLENALELSKVFKQFLSGKRPYFCH